MDIGTLKRIFSYPIKSTSGISLQYAELEFRGIIFDRWFAIYNPEGKIASGKNTRRFFRLDNIIDIKVNVCDSHISVASPEGKKYSVPSRELNKYLSELLSVELEVKSESSIPHMDDGRVHLLTTEDLKLLSAKHGSDVSPMRFRPNLLIESKHTSSELLNSKILMIGDVAFEPIKPTERCRMITMSQGNIGNEAKLLKNVSESGKIDFGIYLEPLKIGRVNVGSHVEVA